MQRLKMALVGGGFIGRVHARAARLDDFIEVVAGCLSGDPARSRERAAELGIPRAYATPDDLLAAEHELDLIAVATPNDTHRAIAGACLEARVPVICEKPLTITLAEAEELAAISRRTGAPLALMHNYTGYPLVTQLRAMVARGDVGQVIAARAAYYQGSAWRAPEPGGQPRAPWRFDPRRAGPSGAFADIGTHAYNLLRHVTRLVPEALTCSLRTYTPGRSLDDYGAATLKLAQGALATITASKVSHGRENDLSIHIDGTKGSLEWHQEDPNRLLWRVTGEPLRVLTRDPRQQLLAPEARAAMRLPAGHPESFHEAFANVYAAFVPDVRAYRAGAPLAAQHLYPDLLDGVDEMRFVERCLASSARGGAWLDY